jgi:hypothetical protein
MDGLINGLRESAHANDKAMRAVGCDTGRSVSGQSWRRQVDMVNDDVTRGSEVMVYVAYYQLCTSKNSIHAMSCLANLLLLLLFFKEAKLDR